MNFGRVLLICVLLPVAVVHAETEDILYEVHWQGVKKHPQRDALKNASRSETLRNVPPPSLPLLRKRMTDDLPRLTSLLQANGYYSATVKGELDTESNPLTIRFICEPGPLFTMGSQTITYVGGHPPASRWSPYLEKTDPATTRNIETAEGRMLRHFRNNGHPSPVILSRSYLLDLEARQMDLSYEIDPGAPKRMGSVEVQGLVTIGEKSILRQVNWEPGDPYDLRLIETFEKDLILTGLFSRVVLSPKVSEEESPQMDFILTVTERHHRTLRQGVNYRSDVGFGLKSSWEHRNFFGQGERFKVDFTLAEEETIASAWLRKPGFQIRNQSLILGVKASEERPDAYTSLSLESSVALERQYNPQWSNSLGIAYKYSTVEQAGNEEIYGLLSLPFVTIWNTSSHDLHPLRGHRLVTETTPYTDLLNPNLTFGRLQVTGSKYFLLTRRPQVVLAGRSSLGSLLGAEVGNIPADERFYAGGGGSVRGFTYQSIGPKEDGQSIGGSSLFDLSLELRTRFTETWGVAAFVDGGKVTSDTSPFGGSQPMQWGAGAGLRIFTGFGPLRLDLAYPLNPEEDQESRLQFYISLGQSF